MDLVIDDDKADAGMVGGWQINYTSTKQPLAYEMNIMWDLTMDSFCQ